MSQQITKEDHEALAALVKFVDAAEELHQAWDSGDSILDAPYPWSVSFDEIVNQAQEWLAQVKRARSQANV